ncbi:uncharacterized protein KGF55_001419 [Candida pseudojiufengensis]|uniref:uncharacterized protein n=1 Tax=Candida pseudojiufengensis TaxID=497109 RepID=UPI0022258821|nr:uncharacterized protein KGF55_001419 [Candida pseudojiufengensis]KAI5965199.1 hypothetical protein KGF55_001419 [Candida pseudojiufengensis]
MILHLIILIGWFTKIYCFQNLFTGTDFHFKDYDQLYNYTNGNINSNSIVHYKNIEELQQNLKEFYSNYDSSTTTILFHLIDDDHYLIPDTIDFSTKYSTNKDSTLFKSVAKNSDSNIPQNWIEFYTTNIHHYIDPKGIEIQTLTTVNSEYARGEVAYSLGSLKRIATEYDMNTSLFLGLNIFIGGIIGLRFAPEINFSSSYSTFYTCPVTSGKTVLIKVYPYITNLNPYYKNLKWNNKLKKFVTNFKFTKLDKVKLFTMTGLEDVECVYI